MTGDIITVRETEGSVSTKWFCVDRLNLLNIIANGIVS